MVNAALSRHRSEADVLAHYVATLSTIMSQMLDQLEQKKKMLIGSDQT